MHFFGIREKRKYKKRCKFHAHRRTNTHLWYFHIQSTVCAAVFLGSCIVTDLYLGPFLTLLDLHWLKWPHTLTYTRTACGCQCLCLPAGHNKAPSDSLKLQGQKPEMSLRWVRCFHVGLIQTNMFLERHCWYALNYKHRLWWYYRSGHSVCALKLKIIFHSKQCLVAQQPNLQRQLQPTMTEILKTISSPE